MIRFIFAIALVVLFFIVSFLIFPIEWIIGKFSQKAKDKSQLAIIHFVLSIFIPICGIKMNVIGKENLPDEPTLYIANHRSFFDVIILYSLFQHPTGFIAKKSVGKVPALRTWLLTMHGLLLDRDDIKQGLKTILAAIENVKNGYSMCIFPEGTRNKGEELSLLEFKEGSFKVATKTGCKIVPIAFNNTAEIFENHFPRIKRTNVVVEIGKPIDPKDLSKEELKHIGVYFHDMIQDTIQKNAKLVKER